MLSNKKLNVLNEIEMQIIFFEILPFTMVHPPHLNLRYIDKALNLRMSSTSESEIVSTWIKWNF